MFFCLKKLGTNLSFSFHAAYSLLYLKLQMIILYVLSTIQNCSIELISVQYKYEIVQFNKLLSGINIKVQVGFTKNNCRYNKPCANEVFSLSSGDTKSGTITGKRLFKLNHTFCFTNYL